MQIPEIVIEEKHQSKDLRAEEFLIQLNPAISNTQGKETLVRCRGFRYIRTLIKANKIKGK